MANHAYAKTGKKLDPKEVDANIRKIVAEKLAGIFSVDYNKKEKLWLIHYKGNDYIGFQMWISDDKEYGEMKNGEFIEYKNPKIISKNSVLEFRHEHAFRFMWWVEGVIRENLGKIYNARMFDDGCEMDPKPNTDKFETFETFCVRGEKNKKIIKELKKNYLGWQKDDIPKEVIEKLNLDFKI